jgi:hypothetical protein
MVEESFEIKQLPKRERLYSDLSDHIGSQTYLQNFNGEPEVKKKLVSKLRGALQHVKEKFLGQDKKFKKYMALLTDQTFNEEVLMIKPGQIKEKQWRVRNCSNKMWPQNVILKNLTDEIVVDPCPIPSRLCTGETADISLPITVKEHEVNESIKVLIGVFMLYDLDKQETFGEKMTVLIQVDYSEKMKGLKEKAIEL